MAASVGALLRGFRTYEPEVRVAGVILNRVGGAGHYRYLIPAIEGEGVAVLGYLPKQVELGIPGQMRAMASMTIPLGRPARPDEAAGTVLFLSSRLSNYVHGQIINVTGGQFSGMTM